MTAAGHGLKIILDASSVTSHIGLWTAIFNAGSWHFGHRHLGYSEPEVSIFGHEGGAEEYDASKPVLTMVLMALC